MVLAEVAEALDMRAWQLQEAKDQLSEVIETAQVRGPQMITRHGRPRAVLLSAADYAAMTSQRPDFKEWLLGGPKANLASPDPAFHAIGESEG
jgi:prevent-host-death family protein